MSDDVLKRLNQLKIEDIIWIIYLFLILFSLISNKLERRYFIYNDENSRDAYRKLTIVIFLVALLAYLYYFYDSYTAYRDLNSSDSEKKQKLTFYSFVGSSLILIAGVIFLYIAISDVNLETEVAFN